MCRNSFERGRDGEARFLGMLVNEFRGLSRQVRKGECRTVESRLNLLAHGSDSFLTAASIF
jgi:hypothetical protein